MGKEFDIERIRTGDCCCGNPVGTNDDCERCFLVALVGKSESPIDSNVESSSCITEKRGELVNQASIIVNQFESGFIECRSVGMGIDDEAELFADNLAHALCTTLKVAFEISQSEQVRSEEL